MGMKLNLEEYIISRPLMNRILEVLNDNRFLSDDEDEYNNEDVIDLVTALEAELQKQDSANPTPKP
jgi:hypothetical protein